MTVGCKTFKTSSITRHEATSEKVNDLRVDFKGALQSVNTEEYKAMLITIIKISLLACIQGHLYRNMRHTLTF